MADARDDFDKIEEVSKVTRNKGTGSPAEEFVERVAPNKEHFESLMRQDITQLPEQEAQKTSFMDQVRELQKKVGEIETASPDTLIQKAHTAIAQIEDVKGKLAQPNLEIKGSIQTLLTNKLSHIDESLKVALNRAGSEYASPVAGPGKGEVASPQNPIERFLGFLTHGQYQLQKLAEDVHQMHLSKTEISPASMLAIQIKVGYVQQEIEFFTALLNKALESTKTIMNVQV